MSTKAISSNYVLPLPSQGSCDILINALRSKNQQTITNAFIAIEGLSQPERFFSADDLGRTFVLAIQEGFDSYYDRLLRLQEKVGAIPTTSVWGLGNAFREAIKKQDTTAFSAIITQKAFGQIKAVDSSWGLNYALLECLRIILNESQNRREPLKDFLQEIVRHPNAGQINNINELDSDINLVQIYSIVQKKGYNEIVQLIDEFTQKQQNRSKSNI